MSTDAPTPPQPPARPRGPMVELDPSGRVSLKEADRAPRQFLNYAFFRIDPAFRRLPREERCALHSEYVGVLQRWAARDDVILRTYTLEGLRADCDFMLWRIANDVRRFNEMQRDLNATRMAGWLTPAYSFLSLQKRSQYVNRIEGSGHGIELLPGEGQFLFVYPFVKTRAWYALSPHARQGMMDEHIHVSSPFKGVRLNTSYSYGIDDQEFVVAFDSDYPQEFVDLVGRLRYTEASLYTQRDTPMFTCLKTPPEGIFQP
ncbi:MAG: chlorite dismutase family protein [Tepidiforma sp.]